MDFLQLPDRTIGKRSVGLTSIIDSGTPIRELEHILEDYHSFIDIAKIGMGSAYVTPNLQDKIKLYQEYGISPYCGGTLFEKCYLQNKLTEYLNWIDKLGIEWVEISNGTVDIPFEKRLELVTQIKKHFNVMTEVGSKNTSFDVSISQWRDEIASFLEAGSQYVITEGRDSGTAGIYDRDGIVKEDLISDIVEGIDQKKIIFEAPTPKHQMYFINLVGPNVNLGNIKLSDVLILETQRCGLRSETLYMEGQEWKLPL